MVKLFFVGICLLFVFLDVTTGKPKGKGCGNKSKKYGGKPYRHYGGYRHGYRGLQYSDNHCTSTTCQNGGSCGINPEDGSAICCCLSGFSGDDCSVTACSLITCQNGGTCQQNAFGQAICSCPDNYQGSLCEIDCNAQQVCPDGFQELPPDSGNCFYICPSDSQSHLSAQAFCLSMGSTLWEPANSTGAEVTAVTGVLIGTEKYWTGGYDGLEEGSPLYLGSGSPVSLGSHTDDSNTSEKDCIEVFKSSGTWVFEYRTCTVTTRRCICQKLGPCDVPAFVYPGFSVAA